MPGALAWTPFHIIHRLDFVAIRPLICTPHWNVRGTGYHRDGITFRDPAILGTEYEPPDEGSNQDPGERKNGAREHCLRLSFARIRGRGALVIAGGRAVMSMIEGEGDGVARDGGGRGDRG